LNKNFILSAKASGATCGFFLLAVNDSILHSLMVQRARFRHNADTIYSGHGNPLLWLFLFLCHRSEQKILLLIRSILI